MKESIVEISINYGDAESGLNVLEKVKRDGKHVFALIHYVSFATGHAVYTPHFHALSGFHIADGRLMAISQLPNINYKIPYAKLAVHTTFQVDI